MLIHRLFRWLPTILFLLCGILVGISLVAAHKAIGERRTLGEEMAAIRVQPPAGPPSITQESLNLALVIYNIRVPEHVDHPVLNTAILDRGLTSRTGISNRMKVTIGPGAFNSWALLGSTLAHELEVHCLQNFGMIRFLDLLGLDGTGHAERQAYAHEINQAERFGLGKFERRTIQNTVEFYYPPRERDDSLAARLHRSVRGLF